MHSSRAYFATYVYVYHALYEPQRNGDQLELSHDMNIKMATKWNQSQCITKVWLTITPSITPITTAIVTVQLASFQITLGFKDIVLSKSFEIALSLKDITRIFIKFFDLLWGHKWWPTNEIK